MNIGQRIKSPTNKIVLIQEVTASEIHKRLQIQGKQLKTTVIHFEDQKFTQFSSLLIFQVNDANGPNQYMIDYFKGSKKERNDPIFES
jgi:hypothetical protein